MEVTVTGSVETDLHGHMDYLYAYDTESVLCMGLPTFHTVQHPTCTGAQGLTAHVHIAGAKVYVEILYCGMSSPLV